MRMTKSLNINNTFRSANLNARVRRDKVYTPIYINDQSAKEIKEYLQHPDQYIFIIDHESKEPQGISHLVLETPEVLVDYHTSTVTPLWVITALVNNGNGRVVYDYHGAFTDEQLQDVYRTSMLCKLAINIPITIGVSRIKQVLFDLFDTRYLIDEVTLDFHDYHASKQEYEQLATVLKRKYKQVADECYRPTVEAKLGYYLELHEYFARWKMLLTLLCEDETEVSTIMEEGVKLLK